MKLRVRLALAMLAAALPAVIALLWYDEVQHHRAAERVLFEFVSTQLEAIHQRCDASPDTLGGPLDARGFDGAPPPPPPLGPTGRHPLDSMPPPPPRSPFPRPPHDPHDGRVRAKPAEVFGYRADFSSRNPSAPPISTALLQRISGNELAIEPLGWERDRVELLIRTAWPDGPCAYVLARGTTDPSWGAVLPESPLWLVPLGVMLAGVLLAMAPVVRRIRQLTDEVERSASHAYASSISVTSRDEIGDLARAFDKAGSEIRRQLDDRARREEALREFLANTTHDVMIPLTVLQGHLARLRDRAARNEALEPQTIASAMNETHYMASLVHNLSAAVRLEVAEAKVHPTDVDFGAMVTRVVERHRPIAQSLNVSLDGSTPAWPVVVRADITLIEQAVSNLVYNAVRYNHPGGHVAVILEETRQAPGDAARAGEGKREPPKSFSLRVIDDGPGIPESELTKIRQRGGRGDSARTRAPEGQGLGLDIAFRVTELHGFSLVLAKSEYGGLEVALSG